MAEVRGRPGYGRDREPSNLRAISRRYQARIVSGLARPPSPELSARAAFRSPQVCVARDPTGAAVLASGRGEFGSPQPGTRSGGATPGSPAQVHTPVDEPTGCRSCELSIIADF